MAAPATVPVQTPTKPKQPWRWNVVLLDDQEHTYDYVIRMMQELFAHGKDRAIEIAKCVDKDGRAVCLTTHKEHAELKREQILAFGRDPLMTSCKGSMSAIIEPAIDGDEPGRGNTAGSGGAGHSGGAGGTGGGAGA